MNIKLIFAATLILIASAGSAWSENNAPIYNSQGGTVTRCPAGDSGCTIYNATDRMQDRVDQGKKDVQNADSPLDKVKEIGKTVRDCLNCGMDAVKRGAGDISR